MSILVDKRATVLLEKMHPTIEELSHNLKGVAEAELSKEELEFNENILQEPNEISNLKDTYKRQNLRFEKDLRDQKRRAIVIERRGITQTET